MALADDQTLYRALSARDSRFDGRVFVGVTSTGIYCRPVCPARTPRAENCRFYVTAAAAAAAGFRACRRCRPDSIPGSRDWDHRGDLAARALRLIAAGEADRGAGVSALATRLHVSERQLHRVLVAEVGVGPLELARTRRAQTARLLLERTDLPVTDVAFAAGFGSLRQFNEVIREQFGRSPSALRSSSGKASSDGIGRSADGRLNLRLPVRLPFDAEQTLRWVAARAVPGVELVDVEQAHVLRVLRLPGGPGVARLALSSPEPRTGGSAGGGMASVAVTLWLPELPDVARATAGLRAWLDLDADPTIVAQVLGQDPALATLLAGAPGLRLPGTPDPCEQAIRAVLGQQVSVAAARNAAGRLVAAFGEPVTGFRTEVSTGFGTEVGTGFGTEVGTGFGTGFGTEVGTGFGTEVGTPPPPEFTVEVAGPPPTELSAFPSPEALAEAGADAIRAAVPMPASKARTLALVAEELASGRLDLGRGADRERVGEQLLAIPGIGPWTVSYITMRALGDPDAFPESDLGIRKGASALGLPSDGPGLLARAERWRPWRGYAAMLLWQAAHVSASTEMASAAAPQRTMATRRTS